MTETTRSRHIDAPPAAVWAVLADFGSICRWAPGAQTSAVTGGPAETGVGTVRRITAGPVVLVERIVDFVPEDTLAYAIEGLPGRVSAQNRWTLAPDGDGTLATVTSSFDVSAGVVGGPLSWLAARGAGLQSAGMLAGLARFLTSSPA